MVKTFTKPIVLKFLSKDWLCLQERLYCTYGKYQYAKDNIPLSLRCFLISGEDHRYFQHPGFDIIAICRAIWHRISRGIQEGASTIEQQLVRTLTNERSRTLKRKLKEILLATLIIEVVPKREIPGLYLMVGYYGWRMNGLLQAYQRLDMNSSNLSPFKAAALVSRLKYPEPRVAPRIRKKQINNRAKHLLNLFSKHSQQGTYDLLKDFNYGTLYIKKEHKASKDLLSIKGCHEELSLCFGKCR